MGFRKWLARRVGTVGGTARWAANGYRFFRQRHPDQSEFSDADIFRLLIVTRYETIPNAEFEAFLLSVADHLVGLRALVVSILTVEAGFTENTPAYQQMFMDVIDEELGKKGLPEAVIFGSPQEAEA